MIAPKIITAPNLTLYFWPHYLDATSQEALLDCLKQQITWRIDKIKIFGKTHYIPRQQAFIGDAGLRYRYSHLTLNASPWPLRLQQLRDQVAFQCDTSFNCALLNHYRDGQDRMGWHSDAEPELGQNPMIASVSLGAARRFVLRHRTRPNQAKIDLMLNSGSLLLMAGETQHFWQHTVPATKRINQARYNLTFRDIKTEDA